MRASSEKELLDNLRPEYDLGALEGGAKGKYAKRVKGGEGLAMRAMAEKAAAFWALHERDRAFVIPNPWEVGTARMLAGMGFEALATTSAGFAFSQGQRDFTVGRERMLRHVAEIAAATDLPVSADLENCFGDDPATVAETIRLSGETGIVGGSVEDGTTRPGDPIYEFGLAVERVRAVDAPVNVVMGLQGAQLSLADLSALGVKRVSVGSAFARAAFGAFLRAAREVREKGTFTFAAEAVSYRDISAMFGR